MNRELKMAEVEEHNNRAHKKTTKYNYLLIMFNKRGPRTGRPVYDFVPSSWVYVSKKTGKLVVKFMPPPYVDETSALLHHLIETLSDPIADWPEYNIQLKGGAESHEKAAIRLAELEAKEYAFTTDADEEPAEKASRILRQLKQTKLKVSAVTEAALQVPELNSDEDQDCLPKGPINATDRQVLKPKCSRSIFLGNKDTSSVLHGDDQTGNPTLKDFKKNQTDVTMFSSKALDENANLEIQHLEKKKPVSNERLTIINTHKQASTFQSNNVASFDESSNLSSENLPEQFHSSNRGRSKLFFDNVYTDSENEGRIDNNRTVYSVRDSSPKSPRRCYDLSESSHSKSSVLSRTKPLKPKWNKSVRKDSTSRDEPRLKPKRTENKSTSKQAVSKSKPNTTEGKSKGTDLNRKGSKSGEVKSRDDFTSDSELLWKIYEDLQAIKVDVGEIRANQRKEEEIRHKSTVEHGIQENFISKHNLKLPYTQIDAFDEFNSNLLSNEDFRQEFMKSLVKFFDRDLIASKTVINILKKYLSRQLAMQHTALKKMQGKFLMKNTAFYDCLLGVLTETHRDKCGKFISESTFSVLLGNALGNAKDWDGRRNRHNQLTNPDEVGSD